jgi:hypothetical protein
LDLVIFKTEKEALLEQINHHLEQNSIIVSLGSINIIDTTVIEAKQSRKRKGRNGNNTQDPEADYNVKIAADGKRKTTNKTMPKRIQLPDDFYKHDFKQLAKVEKHPRTRIRFNSFWHCFVGEKNDYYTLFMVLLFFEFGIITRWRS